MSNGSRWFQSNPITAVFTSNVKTVSILGIDVGANGLRMDAYDKFNNLIAFDEKFGF